MCVPLGGGVGPQLLHQCCVQGSFEVVRRYLKENARSEAWPFGGVCVCECVCVWAGWVGPQLLHPRCVQGSFEAVRRYLKEKARFET